MRNSSNTIYFWQLSMSRGVTTCYFYFMPVDYDYSLLETVSPPENFKVVLKENKGNQFLEIWSRQCMIRCVDINALEVHGKVYTHGDFASFEWSPDEKKILYVAEKRIDKGKPFYKRRMKNCETDLSTEDVVTKGEEYVYRQDWGEGLAEKIQSVVCEFDIENDSVQMLRGIPENICPARPSYSPHGSYVVGIAYRKEPRKLGLSINLNRLSTIYQVDFQGNYVELNLDKASVKSPKFTPDGKKLIWLQRSTEGPHEGCRKLMKTDMPITVTVRIISSKGENIFPHRYAVLLVNFRGSVGVGEESINFLLGKIGQSDVADCILSIETVLKKFSFLDPNTLILVGNSHGGFMVTQLSGQYPEVFKAVVTRNPVIDVASMSVISDIPDWLLWKQATKALLKMRKSSPLKHAHKVKAPTLLQIGSVDLRVPMFQGMEYYHRLKANGITTKMYLYQDNHRLEALCTEIDTAINTILWIQKYTTGNPEPIE